MYLCFEVATIIKSNPDLPFFVNTKELCNDFDSFFLLKTRVFNTRFDIGCDEKNKISTVPNFQAQ